MQSRELIKKLISYLIVFVMSVSLLGAPLDFAFAKTSDDSKSSAETSETNADSYPAFNATVDAGDVSVSVKAPKGAFPEGSTLSVDAVPQSEQEEIDEAVMQERDGDSANVAASYTFDIKVLDQDGNELQPANGSNLEVSFTADEVKNKNLETQVYHISDDLTAEALNVETKKDTATVTTDGFSYYTVEFTYGDLQYVLPGDSQVALSAILDAIGLAGTPTAVEVSNEELFSAAKEGGEWIIKSQKAFSTNEWMKVTIDGIVYEIVVTDATVNAISDLPLRDIPAYRFDTTKFTLSNATVDIDPGSSIFLSDTEIHTSASSYTGGTSVNKGSVKITYDDAAIDKDGNTYNVEFYFKNITIYPQNTRQNRVYYLLSFAGIPQVSVGHSTGSGTGNTGNAPINTGISMDLDITIVGASGSTADFIYSFNDFNTSRSSTWGDMESNYGPGTNSFNESIKILSGGEAYYADSRALNSTYMRDGWYVPGYDSAGTGDRAGSVSEVVVVSDSPTISVSLRTHLQSGSSESGSYRKPINILPGSYYHPVTMSSDSNGTIAVWKDGQLGNDGEELYEGQGPRTFDVPNGKEVEYKMTPNTGFTPDEVLVDGSAIDMNNDPNFASVDSDSDGIPEYYTYKFGSGATGAQTIEVRWKQGRTFKTTSGANGSYEIIDTTDSNNSLYSGTGNSITSVPDYHEVKYKLTPGRGVVVDKVTVDGTVVTVTNNEFTIPADANNHNVNITWKTKPAVHYSDCDDCKNPQPCDDCHNALDGNDIGSNASNDYTKETEGVYRGLDAKSGVSATSFDGETEADNTFAQSLPYGNVFVDTSKLSWKNSNTGNFHIDIQDPRFKLVGTGKTTNGGSTMYSGITETIGPVSDYSNLKLDADLVVLSDVGSPKQSVPMIAYYGPIHSYLMYGTEEADTEPTSPGNVRKLGNYDRDNTAASAGKIASGTYTVTEGGTNYSVQVVNGTNLITAAQTGKDFLYRITYDNAVVLQDGTRGKLVITVTKVELESSYTTSGNAYIGLQKENEMTVSAHFVKEGTSQTTVQNASGQTAKNNIKYFPGRTNIAGKSPRNAVGERITYNIQVQYPDGTPVDGGAIAYAAKDLDVLSYESLWGRQPDDSYTGTSAAISSDPVKSKWTDVHEFYDYAEGMQINSGAVSYALIPNYDHADGTNYSSGKIPIDQRLDDAEKYNVPLQVLRTGASADDGSANGVRFVTTASAKTRDNSGTFTNGYQDPSINPSSTTVPAISGEAWAAPRSDQNTYDTGFAVLLDATGSELVWTGSNHTNDWINTWLFDSAFATYLVQSHGTGGGIHLENYKVSDKCEPTFIEGVAVFGVTAGATVSIVPEDGYRVKEFHIDNVRFEVDEENNTISYGGSTMTLTQGTDAQGNTIYVSAEQTVTTSKNTSGIKLKVTRYDDGTYDVKLTDVAPGTNIHADFEADYYFQKVWEGGAAQDVPDKLYMTAVPYVAAHDSVTIGNTTYQISRTESGGGVTTTYTDENDPSSQSVLETDLNNLRVVGADEFPAAKYPMIMLGGAAYVVMGNYLYKIVDTTASPWVVDSATPRIEIKTKLIRAEMGTKSFVVCKTDAENSSNTYVEKEVKDGNVIWKIRYPEGGVVAGSTGVTEAWPALPIEIEDVTSPSHNTTEDHVKRIYWFATEDIDKLNEGWILEEYKNEYSNDNIEVAGLATYKDSSDDLIYKNRTYWYTQSTKDHDGVRDYMEDMASIQLAYMDPISEKVVKNSNRSDYYTGWGGKVTNRVIETKLKVFKEWLNDSRYKKLREDLKITIKREYSYSQKTQSDLDEYNSQHPSKPKKWITLPTGAAFNQAMGKISGNKAEITAFKRGTEPLLVDKTRAKDIGDTSITAGDYVKYTDSITTSGKTTELYVWYDASEKCIYYWTDANEKYIFLNSDSKGMFKDMPGLKETTGLDDFNTTKVVDMSEMFAVKDGSAAGSIEGLSYLRKWDTSNVRSFEEMFYNQDNLKDVNGVIDWCLEAASTDEAAYQGIFDNGNGGRISGIPKGKAVFVYYPHLLTQKNNGNLKFKTDDNITAGDIANNLVFDKDDISGLNIGEMKDTATDRWTWDLVDTLLYSDEAKWTYKVYEDEIRGYTNLDGAEGEANAVVMTKNPATGILEYTLVNSLDISDLTLAKIVTGNMGSRDKYFKFEVEIEDLPSGYAVTIEKDKIDLTTSKNNATNQSYYSTTDSIMDNKNRRDDNKDTGDGYQVVAATLDATQYKWIDANVGTTVYTYNPGRAEVKYTQQDFDNYRSKHGVDPPWNVDDIKIRKIDPKWEKYTNVDFTTNEGTLDEMWSGTPPANSKATIGYYTTSAATPTAAPIKIKYEDVNGLPDDGEGKVKFDIYLQHGEQIVVKALPFGSKYKITEEDAVGYKTSIYNGTDGLASVIKNGREDSGTFGITVREDNENGTYYKLKNAGEKHENPKHYYLDFNGSNLNSLPKYKYDSVQAQFVVDNANGTYYKVVDNNLDGAGEDSIKDGIAYSTVAPSSRYDTSKKYVVDLTRAYHNEQRAAIPTEVRTKWLLGIFMVLLMILAILLYLIKQRRDRYKEELAEAGLGAVSEAAYVPRR